MKRRFFRFLMLAAFIAAFAAPWSPAAQPTAQAAQGPFPFPLPPVPGEITCKQRCRQQALQDFAACKRLPNGPAKAACRSEVEQRLFACLAQCR